MTPKTTTMKKLIYPALIGLALTTSAFTIALNTTWTVNESAYAVKMKSDKFEGQFKGLKSTLVFDENNLAASKLVATIDPASVNTGNGMRNKHARQGLGTDTYKSISFESTTISKKGNGYEAVGKLTIRDVTKEMVLPFAFTRNGEGGVFSGNFSVATKDYHIEKSGTPATIQIELNIPVTK